MKEIGTVAHHTTLKNSYELNQIVNSYLQPVS